MPARSILLVAHIAPPSPMSAARRVSGLTRHLGRLGHRVTLVTSLVSGSGAVDGATRVVRTRDLMVSPLNWRRGNFEALQGVGGEAADYSSDPSIVARIVVPDLEMVGWTPFATVRALAEHRHRPFDCVITTAPPFSGHLVGLALSARGMPWVADFRDGWIFEGSRPPFPLAAQRGLDRRLERLVAWRADAVVGVTPPIAEDLAGRLGARATTITNGWDPDEQTSDPADWQSPLRAERCSLVYTGSLAYGGSDPAALIDALHRLRERDPVAADALELVVAGALEGRERAQLQALEPMVRLLGPVPRNASLALQRQADALLLLAGDKRPSVATGKLYEYLRAGRPILVVGRRSVAARIVEEARAGTVVEDGDVDGLVEALLQLATGPPVAGATAEAADRFAYPRLAAAMAEQVEVAISARASRAGSAATTAR